MATVAGSTAAPTPRCGRRRPTPATAVLAVATAGMAGTLGAIAPRPSLGALHALLVLLIVPCAIVDLRRRIIPNRITGPGALALLILGLAVDPGGEPVRLLWAALAGGFLLIFAFISPAGMGMGDVKLLGVMGLALGPPVMVALMVALLGNVGAAAVIAARHGVRRARKATLPFGPFLGVGAILAALAGSTLLQAWLTFRI